MERYELPDGWVWTKIIQLVDIIMGQSPPSSTYNDEGIGLPFYQGKADFGEIYPTPRKWCSAPGKIAEPGDILMSVRAPVGPTNLADRECCIGRGLSAIRPLAEIPSHFIFHYLRFIEQNIADMGQGSTFTAISRSDVENIDVPLAPLREQLRIVEKIEALFAQSRTAREALDAIPALLRQFRQAVLAAAFRGELSTRDPNDEPASVLLERILEERRRRWEENLRAKGKDPRRYTYPEPVPPDTRGLPELPEGWCYTFLQPLLSLKRRGIKTGPFGSLLKKDEHRLEGIPVFGIENIGVMRFVPGSKIHLTLEKAEQLSEYDAQPGDVLISRSGTVGEVCVVPEGLGEARISTNLMRVVLEPGGMLPEFFCLVFNGSQFVLDQIAELCKGSTREFLNQEILLSIVFPLPPLAEQQRIVSRVQSLFAQADVIQVATDLARHRLDRLDQSILARAFRGELVPQDPNDEPASVLLERIRAEKARRAGERPSRRRNKGRK